MRDRFTKYGSAPIIFADEKQKEWEDLNPEIKKSISSRLHETTKILSLERSIELLCHVINDLNERIDKLENK